MNMIQFSNGLVEAGNVRNVVHPLPSFNPAPEQLPGAEVKEVTPSPLGLAAGPAEAPANAADSLPKEPVVPLTPAPAETAPEAKA
jgi:hypothetical protein